ncbi:MAG: ATP-binding cassette domain-containing protein [Coriobacteriia bacterium]|nr:ATP-binding cassette domain-containing protein [Coriobacteriia bacterium]
MLLWQALALYIDNDILLASPIQTLLALQRNLLALAFWSAIGFSALRISAGFLLAFASGLALGAVAWRWPYLGEFLQPALSFIKSVPIVCFIVMLLIWFGSPWVSLAAVFLVAFPSVYFAVLDGLEHRDVKLGEMLDVFDVYGLKKLALYYWPSLLPFLQVACKTAIGMSWKSGVAAELIGLPLNSIGERIYRAKILLDSADVFAWTATVVSVSILAEFVFFRALNRSDQLAWQLSLAKKSPRVQKTPAPTDISIRHLNKSYGEKPVLVDLSLELLAGKRYLMNDPSGTGKTTLLRLLLGLEAFDSGSIVNNNRLAMVFQEPRLFEDKDALENLQVIVGKHHDVDTIRLTLLRLLPEESLASPVKQLSGGMRRRVELCRALLAPSQVILLDEPFAGLDAASSAMAQELVLSMLDSRSLVVVSHDLDESGLLGLKTVSLVK